jgi:hypothetical protein
MVITPNDSIATFRVIMDHALISCHTNMLSYIGSSGHTIDRDDGMWNLDVCKKSVSVWTPAYPSIWRSILHMLSEE